MDITPELIVTFANAVLSLLFEYVPGLRDWFGGQLPERKRQVVAGLALGVAVVIFALGCTGYIGTIECTVNGLVGVLWLWILGLMGSQVTHLVAKRPAIDG